MGVSPKPHKVESTEDLIRESLADPTLNNYTHLSKVTERERRLIRMRTGRDLGGYTHVLQGDRVRHIMKEHGDSVVEMARSPPHIAVTPVDILRIAEILQDPKGVEDMAPTKGGLRVLRYRKKENGFTYAVVAVNEKTGRIIVLTMYKHKGGSSLVQNVPSGPSTQTFAPTGRSGQSHFRQ